MVSGDLRTRALKEELEPEEVVRVADLYDRREMPPIALSLSNSTRVIAELGRRNIQVGMSST